MLRTEQKKGEKVCLFVESCCDSLLCCPVGMLACLLAVPVYVSVCVMFRNCRCDGIPKLSFCFSLSLSVCRHTHFRVSASVSLRVRERWASRVARARESAIFE